MACSPYILAGYSVYWKFPSAAERLAHAAVYSEEGRIAWQASDNTFWVLTDFSAPTWIQIGGRSIVGGGLFPFYTADIVYMPIGLTADGAIPFYTTDGVAHDIPLGS